MPVVGDVVYLPSTLPPGHAGYELQQTIISEPGRVVSVEDGWAMVDRAGWGQFGNRVTDLALAHCGHWRDGDGQCCRCGEPNWCPDDGETKEAIAHRDLHLRCPVGAPPS